MSLRILNIKDTCTGCSACVAACPKKALTLSYDEEGFYYPHLANDKCVDCKICETVCQVLNDSTPEEPSSNYTAYMLKAKNKDIVKKSSSGGAFSLLAEAIMLQGGIVFGARYNYEKERLEHCSTAHCSIEDLRKSKYIESYVGESFIEVVDCIKRGQSVLFCGTPCQIQGLYDYVKTKKMDTSNLLLVRFVCHGVPSNQFFTDYKRYEEKRHRAKMVHFDFRPKTRGWRAADWLMSFENGKTIAESTNYSHYYYYFQKEYLLRRSCYRCRRVFHEIADITIADFWAIHTYQPENKDQEGISLVLGHTEKGLSAIEAIKSKADLAVIPNDAFPNIYREARSRSGDTSSREKEMEEVLKNGYMPVARKRLKMIIIKNKTKDYISKIIRLFKS